MAVYRVLIADNNPAFVDAARKHLAIASDLMVVGFAQSGNDVMAQISALRPEVLLLSVNLPDSGGLALVRRIKSLTEAPVVVVLALDILDDYRVAAVAAGADGFVAKSEFASQSIPLIHALCLPVATREPANAGDAATLQTYLDGD